MSNDAKEKTIALLGGVSVDLNAVAWTAVYTVPPGKKCLVDHVKPRNLSADAASTVLTLGQSGAKTDFLGAQTLSNLNAAGKSCKLMPVPAATPVAIVEYAAGVVLGVDVTTAAGGACTAIFEYHGKLADA